MRRRWRAVAIFVLVTLAAIVVAWPEVSYWRLRYWVGDHRQNALNHLMRATPGGGGPELWHATKYGDDLLRRDAADYLAKRGDAEGVRIIVEFCYENPDGCLKWSPQDMLRETVVAGDPRLDAFPDADAWWEAQGPALRYGGDGRWRVEPLAPAGK